MELNAKKLLAAVVADLSECRDVLIRYVAACFIVLALYRLALHGLYEWAEAESRLVLASSIRLGMAIYLAVAASALMAIFFSALGARIDRPIWKCAGAGEALRRFFVPWLIINLFTITLIDVQTRLLAAERGEVAALLELLVLTVHLAAVPVGACVMHWGALAWHELGAALKPLVRMMSLTLLPLAIAFLQYVFMNLRAAFLVENDAATFMTYMITDIPLLLLDALIFGLVWRICMHCRNVPEEEVDPFDL